MADREANLLTSVTKTMWRCLWVTFLALVTLMVALLGGLTVKAKAAPVAKQPKPTQLAVEWKAVPPKKAGEPAAASASEAGPREGYWYAGRLLDPFRFARGTPEEQDGLIPAFAVTATLRDAAGQPISFKTVEFALKTSFGKLSFGTRPTTAEGKAQLLIRDRRYGGYPLTVRFQGDGEFAPAEMVVPVAFSTRPEPALPKVGVLITPYATPSVGVPFLVFYGIMWAVFAYAFGYLILFRMRRAGRQPSPQAGK